MNNLFSFFLALLIVLLSSCKDKSIKAVKLTAKEELGHYLFFENRLSINHTKSCASCHSPEFAFTDGYRKSITALGENVLHNAPSLINGKFLHFYDWANPKATSLDKQIKRPLYNTHPLELGLDKHITELKIYFENDSQYNALFKKAFAAETLLFTLTQIEECLVAYEKKLVSFNAAYDKNTMSESAKNGFKLFSSNRLQCIQCHTPPNFTTATLSHQLDSVYANIGLYNVNQNNQYPSHDQGLRFYTKKENDDGKFKIPSLRNILLTAPYMHDGSVNTIEEVIDMYARGGRNISYGEFQGDGAENKNKSKLIGGFVLSLEERKDLINFLDALSDTTIRQNAIFMHPFPQHNYE